MTQTSLKSVSFWEKPMVWYGLVIDLIILDQLSKYAIREWLDLPVVLIQEWLQIVFLANKGIAFSLPITGNISVIVAILVSIWLGLELWRKKSVKTVKLAYTLIIAGALGNLIDRLWHGAVTDFISVGSFPVFNFADSFITLGVVLILWHEVTSG